MAHLITVGRLILLFIVVAMIYRAGAAYIAVNMALIAFIIASDGFDGWVARRRRSTSAFGAVFDIAGDRVVENVLWVVFADIGVVPIWIPLLVITRGILVDGLRSLSYSEGMTAFGEKNMMRSSLTRWLTAGRFMRALYGYAKAIAFVFLTGLAGVNMAGDTRGWMETLYDQRWYELAGWLSVWIAVALTIIRGLPVIFDAWLLIVPPTESSAREQPIIGARSRDQQSHQ